MEPDYSIDEILSAVDEIQKTKKERSITDTKNQTFKINKTSIPKDTLKLIEEAEKFIS
tara:strand:+ start:1458 stop:1631 length:174 start_codon:yes stop_codon:yes gene_type:complete